MRTERSDASGTTRYNYDSLGHLGGVTLPGGDEVSYLHDPSGSRTTRSVNGTRTHAWLQAGGRITAQLDASGALEVLYAYTAKSWVPDWALHRDGRLFRVITDHVGSVRLVVDADSGEVVQQYRYSPYGVLEEDITTESIVPHRFAGGHYDEATGLLRFGARDYDPQVGRWTNKDPLGFAAGDTNLYAYVGADPVNGVDPSFEGEPPTAARGLCKVPQKRKRSSSTPSPTESPSPAASLPSPATISTAPATTSAAISETAQSPLPLSSCLL